ncbi:MAG: SLC13 family permease, partial [Pseudomonadota bacterium]
MSFDLAATFALLGAVMALLVWDRLRYDVVAAGALVVAVAVGVVPADKAFVGFSDDIVILVASALVVSAAIERSGIVDRLVSPLARRLDTTPKQVVLLAGLVAALSAVMKNIGALAIFLPVALQVARRHGHSPARLLMPLSFASLLGGIVTMVGTSPNIIVSRVRADLTGEPFGMFSFAPLGLTLSVLGVAFLAFGWRLLPLNRDTGSDQPFSVSDYTAEARLPPASPFVNKTVDDLEDASDGEASVCAIVREGGRRYTPAGHWWLFADDIVVLRCDATVLKRLVTLARLEVPGAEPSPQGGQGQDEIVVEEAVVTEGSPLIGATAQELRLRDHFGLTLVALSRRGRPVRQRLRHTPLYKGDLVVF